MSQVFENDQGSGPCRVLLIEDDDAEAYLISHYLTRANAFECTAAKRLREGLDLLSERPFDVVLLDLGLPDSEGLASLDVVIEAHASVPTIVLTGDEREELAVEAVRRGAQDYLVKGFATEHSIVRALRYAMERKRLEEQVLEAQRMQAVGSLADGIAHEFNNLLQVISGYTRYSLQDLTPASQTYRDLQQVLSAAERATRLTQQLLEFGRPHELNRVRLSLKDHVNDTTRMLWPLLQEEIDLEVDIDESAFVLADENLLQQALINLCLNARDAMPGGGQLRIASRVANIERNSSEHKRLGVAGVFAVLQVADTGCGVPQEIQARIFDPFFTMKSPQEGTGLGLAVVYGVAQKHGGAVEVHSEEGRGARFDLYLPVADQDEAEDHDSNSRAVLAVN